MKKNIFVVIIFIHLSFIIGHLSLVHADYVLPYPSYMPGNKLYKVSRIIDQVKKFWYWGSIAGVKYHLGLSDKYLVEAKTLFEYKQYLLATDALRRSDTEYIEIPQFIVRAKVEGKDITLLEKTVKEAAQTHIQILDGFKQTVPAEFTWTPEKTTPTILPIGNLIETSINIRGQK